MNDHFRESLFLSENIKLCSIQKILYFQKLSGRIYVTFILNQKL